MTEWFMPLSASVTVVPLAMAPAAGEIVGAVLATVEHVGLVVFGVVVSAVVVCSSLETYQLLVAMLGPQMLLYWIAVVGDT